MKIRRVEINNFRRFSSLIIEDLPDVKLVVLAGPNGCGKSSLFDAFKIFADMHGIYGINWDQTYHSRSNEAVNFNEAIRIIFDGAISQDIRERKKLFNFRSAYRNDPEFSFNTLNRMGDVLDDRRFQKMIDSDAAVSTNYQRLVSQAFADVFNQVDGNTTIAEFRENVLGQIRNSILRLFPDLTLNSLGDPLNQGTFRFDKGTSRGFSYKNLSGGEKAAFDLILDLIVKSRDFDDTVFCIDEPETHMNTRLQGALLQELYNIIPQRSQLWISTHSIGMMRKAKELWQADNGSVAFLDFEGHDFDQAVTLRPVTPTRAFWERVLRVALDDLASLVAPREVVICEGNPAGPQAGKNGEHDARCYDTIFADEFPDVKFLSAGNANEVAADRLRLVAALPKVVQGITTRRLIDRDDHGPADVQEHNQNGITVLQRRHLECYLYDDEVLTALCASEGRPEVAADLLADKQAALTDSTSPPRNRPADDIKAAAPQIYNACKQRLGLVGRGNSQEAFARNVLAPLIKPGMATYAALKRDIFGA
ncbi:AAA family ATPase [Methylobacterium oryzae CBMB20]